MLLVKWVKHHFWSLGFDQKFLADVVEALKDNSLHILFSILGYVGVRHFSFCLKNSFKKIVHELRFKVRLRRASGRRIRLKS